MVVHLSYNIEFRGHSEFRGIHVHPAHAMIDSFLDGQLYLLLANSAALARTVHAVTNTIVPYPVYNLLSDTTC